MLLNGACVPISQQLITSSTQVASMQSTSSVVSSSNLLPTTTVSTTTIMVPTFSCISYSQCSFYPSKVTSGCSQSSIVQRDVNGNAVSIINSYTPQNMVQYKCVYQDFALNQWYYCLVDVTSSYITSAFQSTSTSITSSTTLAPTTSTLLTTTSMAPTTTTVIPTTTLPPPPMLPNIAPLSKVVVGIEEYCLSYYIGFDASVFKMPDITYQGAPVFSNNRGCNGSWFARLNDWNQWVGFVCPWKLNEGCNVINSSGYYVVCDGGCYNKAQCATCAAGAYETAPCTSTSNRVCTQYQANVIPSADLRTCNKYSDCDHCPRNGYLGQSDYNVWGCAGHELRMSFFGTETQSFTSSYVLMANYCVYYTNATYAEFCPECFSCKPGID